MSRYRIAIFITVGICLLAVYVLGSTILEVLAIAALVVITGLGVSLPHWQFFGPFICHGATREKKVALTFDDGPDPESTPALLDLLHARGVRATFFCIGKRVEENPELAARIVREGHEIGNHSHAHSNLTNFYMPWQFLSDIRRANDAIRRATGATPARYRPPMGLSCPAMFFATRRLKMPVIGWTARGFDTRVKDPERIVARIVRKLSPGGVILVHDGRIPRERLEETVTTLLDKLKTLGYEVVPLAELLK